MKGASVLVAEHEVTETRRAREYIDQMWIDVLWADSATRAVAMTREHRPGIVFLDQSLSDMDCRECCKALKSAVPRRKVPVIMMADNNVEAARLATRHGSWNGLMTKPVEKSEFLRHIYAHLPELNRREPRIPCHTNVVLYFDCGSAFGTSHDLSVHGMYVAADCSVRNEERIEVSFALPGAGTTLVSAWGRVSWVNEGRNRRKPSLPDGFGLQFLSITDHSSRVLKEFVDRNASSA